MAPRDSRRHQRLDGVAQVALVLLLVVEVLRVEQVVHRHEVLLLAEDAGARAAQLLHVAAHAEHQPQVHAQRPDVRARLARDAEDAEVSLRVVLDQLILLDCPHAQLALDGGDERRPLEERARELVQRAPQRALTVDRVVQPHDGNVLLARSLLRLDEARRTVDAHDEAAGDLGVERAGVAGLLDAEHPPDPRDHLVRRRVGRLVQVDHAILEVFLERPLERRVPVGDGRVVAGAHVELVIVLEQQRPLGGVERRRRLRLDHKVDRILRRLVLLLLLICEAAGGKARGWAWARAIGQSGGVRSGTGWERTLRHRRRAQSRRWTPALRKPCLPGSRSVRWFGSDMTLATRHAIGILG